MGGIDTTRRMRAILPLALASTVGQHVQGTQHRRHQTGSWGSETRLVIFDPIQGEEVLPSEQGVVPVTFAVVGPPLLTSQAKQVCFEIRSGHDDLPPQPVSPNLAMCVPAKPGKSDAAEIHGLTPGQHTLLAAIRWERGDDTGLRRVFFTLSENRTDNENRNMSMFFVGTTRRGHSDTSSQRVFAVINGELLFRSSGSSNEGRNYPGMWFPSAGVCPRSFMQRRWGFHDLLASAHGSEEKLAALLMQQDMMFDKRFSTEYTNREQAATFEWASKHTLQLRGMLADGRLGFDRELTSQSYKDVEAGRHLFYRFSSLAQAVASIRLGSLAWRAAGYEHLAQEILRRGETAGLSVASVTVPHKGELERMEGLCAVNSHAVLLGFDVAGWSAVEHACEVEVEQSANL